MREELIKRLFELVDEDGFTEDEMAEIYDLSEEELEELIYVLENGIDIDDLEEHSCGGNCGSCKEDCHEDKEDDGKETKDDIDVMVGKLAISEEVIRQENLYDKEFEASEETKQTDTYKEMIVIAESIVVGLRVLVDGGVDYANALQICNNQIQNKHNLELAKLTQIQTQNNQI